ncbi:MAG TPA: hypothetical protein VJS85_02195 [Rhizomicrobium sp.]|nr:hypothetical protein [Rhizomicrobium sp.]
MSRAAEGGEMVQWTISSGERRELGRAAADQAAERSEALAEDEKHAKACFSQSLRYPTI